MIPRGAGAPIDQRRRWSKWFDPELKPLFAEIESKKVLLDRQRPLTAGEAARLRDEFAVEYTYNSNAIEGNTLTLRETAMVLSGVSHRQEAAEGSSGGRGAPRRIRLRGEHRRRGDGAFGICHQVDSLPGADRQARGQGRLPPDAGRGHAGRDRAVVPTLSDRAEDAGSACALTEFDKKTMHPIERVARFHLEFECIHPYVDKATAGPAGWSRTMDLERRKSRRRPSTLPTGWPTTRPSDAFSQEGNASPIVRAFYGLGRSTSSRESSSI